MALLNPSAQKLVQLFLRRYDRQYLHSVSYPLRCHAILNRQSKQRCSPEESNPFGLIVYFELRGQPDAYAIEKLVDEMTDPVLIDSDYLFSTLRNLVRIRSVLPEEKAISTYIAKELERMGVNPEWDEVAPGRPNVCATVPLGTRDRFLVFSGHSDTVDVAADWQTDPFEMTERDGRLYGLGIVNMKAGLACQLTAFKALLDAYPLSQKGNRLASGRLGLAVTVDQEGSSIGARALLRTEYGKCDAMLHGEHFFGSSPEDYLPIAGTGKLLYQLLIRGRAAHAFRPHRGINAIDDAARIVSSLDQLPLGEHDDVGKGTACTLQIDGGYKQYSIVVPEMCRVIITRLTVPGETSESALRDMEGLVQSLRLESSVEIITCPPSYDPYRLDESTAVLPVFTQVYRKITGRDPYFSGHSGITDANVFVAEGGIPTVVFGPQGGDHHMAGEYVEKDSLVAVSRVYAETTRRFLNCGPC